MKAAALKPKEVQIRLDPIKLKRCSPGPPGKAGDCADLVVASGHRKIGHRLAGSTAREWVGLVEAVGVELQGVKPGDPVYAKQRAPR
jgi:hypothetical protein